MSTVSHYVLQVIHHTSCRSHFHVLVDFVIFFKINSQDKSTQYGSICCFYLRSSNPVCIPLGSELLCLNSKGRHVSKLGLIWYISYFCDIHSVKELQKPSLWCQSYEHWSDWRYYYLYDNRWWHKSNWPSNSLLTRQLWNGYINNNKNVKNIHSNPSKVHQYGRCPKPKHPFDGSNFKTVPSRNIGKLCAWILMDKVAWLLVAVIKLQ